MAKLLVLSFLLLRLRDLWGGGLWAGLFFYVGHDNEEGRMEGPRWGRRQAPLTGGGD